MKRPPLFRSLVGVALLSAAAFALCAAVGSGTQEPAAIGLLYSVNTTFDANTGADDAAPGDGVCETAAGNNVCTLRAAIEEANGHVGDDGINFNIPTTDPGFDGTKYTINLRKALQDLFTNIDITGPGADKLTVQNVSSGIQFRIFNVTASGTVNFSGLTIGGVDAFGDTSFGGIQNSNTGTVNVTSCTISGNIVSSNTTNAKGGGIYNISGTVNVTNSTLSGNSASGMPFIGFGGGIYNDSGTVTVTNSTLTNNSTVGGCGGGIYNNSGTVNVTNSELSGNFAGSNSSGSSFGGGGICNGGTVNVTNSTLSGNGAFNTATGHGGSGGGGIVNAGRGTVNVTNSTLSGNALYGTTDLGGGGGIFNDSAGPVNVKSSIIAMNTATTSGPDVFGAFNSQGFNLIGKKDGSTGFTAATDKKGTIASPLNPKLDPKGLRDNGGPTQTIALVKGSPAIDKGTSNGLTGTLTTDQRGFARTVDNTSITNASGGDGTDIGAFEFGAQ